ncbi:MAG: hypothetical protein FJX72_00555 [Armatimonadetes bacterium]|nr:hypothetical protein [Armatimonadota bacterium]
MVIEGLTQAPFNSTLMGAMRGAANHFGLGVSDAYLYGASGHAFIMNIHRVLCPSGPYCWDRGPFYDLLRNVGIATTPLGFHHAGTSVADRAASEARLRDALDRGSPCYLVNMEFQLITGYDETGFFTAQPWPGHDFPQAHLTFGTWAELGDEIHMDFDILDRCEPVERRVAVKAALEFAVDLWRRPKEYTSEGYGVGPEAYANWIGAVEAGHGPSHGNWWNGVVWAECRRQASDFLKEVAPLMPSSDDATALACEYSVIAELVERCSAKEMDQAEKLAQLAQARDLERAAISRVERAIEGMS